MNNINPDMTLILTQDFVNRHYRGYLTREDAYYATLLYFKKCLDREYITQKEFELAQKFNKIAFENNQQDIPV